MTMPFSRVSTSLLSLILLVLASTEETLGRPNDNALHRSPPAHINAKERSNEKEPAPLLLVAYQGTRGNINGQVVLPSGQPVNDRVRVTLSGYRIPATISYTDTKGRFTFAGVSDGSYMLEVEGESGLYEPVSQEVRVIYGAHPGLIIALREKKRATIKTAEKILDISEVEQRVPDAAKKEFDEGTQFSSDGRIKDAVERFKRAISIFPEYLMARNNLGAQYLKLGKWAQAAEQFEAAVQINPKALNPRQNLAIALIQQKKYEMAIEHLNAALSIDSSSPTAHLYAGIASLGVEEIDQAERELSKALSLGGAEYSNAHFYLALAYMKNGKREPAKSELKAYLEKLPKGEKAARARELLDKLK